MYDTLSDSIFPTACRRRYAAGVDSLESKNYDQAIEYLTKVVKMDESYMMDRPFIVWHRLIREKVIQRMQRPGIRRW